MKRINPNTGKPFKRGDTREDGMVFKGYQKRRLINGEARYYEMWITHQRFEDETEKTRSGSLRRTETAKYNRSKGIKGKRRNNPDTNQPFKYGDFSEDGSKVFGSYFDFLIKKDGFATERWYSISSFNRMTNKNEKRWSEIKESNPHRLKRALGKAKSRAKNYGIRFDLTSEYITEIFPNDGLCPVFKIPLVWGGEGDERNNSPSLDRIIPELGYVEGNVVWISNRANILKRDATWEELHRVAEWLKSITPE